MRIKYTVLALALALNIGCSCQPVATESGTSSIVGYWQQTDDSQLGFLGVTPKTSEVIIVCKENILGAYAGGIYMMQSEYNISTDKILLKDYNKSFPYRISGDILTLTSDDGMKMIYRKLKGTAKKEFADGVSMKPNCSTED